MIKKFNKYSLKFCRLYEEDVFGKFAIRPKRIHKSLNILYFDFLKQNRYINLLYKRIIKLLLRLNQFKLDVYVLIKFIQERKLFKFFVYARQFLNLFKNKIHYLLGKIQSTLLFFNLNDGKFNYRVDIGKPNRIKRRITRFTLKLLTRHKLTAFAAKIPIYQFKLYIQRNRNLKYFSMYFLFSLESRLDFILYRLNFSNSPGFIRQYIKHKGLLVNNKLITTPSYQVSINDIISFVDKCDVFNRIFYNFYKRLVFMSLPFYYEINFRMMHICFFLVPRAEMVYYPFVIDKFRLSSFGKQF